MSNQHTHPWTQEEVKYVYENIKHLKYKEMSTKLNRSVVSIQSKVRYLPFQQKIKKYQADSDFFKNWSPEMAYIAGFIAANGKISYNLRICDQEIFKDLLSLNITERKSLSIVPPKIPEELKHHFLRGYFDGDGSVYLRTNKYPSKLRTMFYTGSIAMAKFIFIVLKQVIPNFKGQISKKKNKNNCILHLGQKSSEALFEYMYQGASIYMERKYPKFLRGMRGR